LHNPWPSVTQSGIFQTFRGQLRNVIFDNRGSRVVQSRGIVYAKDGWEAVLNRKQQAEEKTAAAAERAQKRKKIKEKIPPSNPFIHWVPDQN
jgi:hypothetical protein